MDALSKCAEFFQPLSRDVFVNKAPAKKTPEEFLDVILAVTFRPCGRIGLSRRKGLDSNQFAAADFFKNKGREVKGDVMVSGGAHSFRRIEQRAGVVDARLHGVNGLLVNLSTRAHRGYQRTRY